MMNYQNCTVCVMDTSASNIKFDEKGQCNYCKKFIKKINSSKQLYLEDLIKNVQAKNIKVYITNIKHHLKELLNKVEFNKHIGEEHYKDSKEFF